MNLIEAVDIATDPYFGGRTAYSRPSPSEVVRRLNDLGYLIVNERDERLRRIALVYPKAAAEARRAGIEQYQAEDR